MKKKEECLSDSELGSLLDARLDQAMLAEAGRCLTADDRGFGELLTLCRVIGAAEPDAFPEIPRPAIEKALRAYPSRQGIVDVVLGFAQDAMRIVQCSPEIGMLAPAPAFGLRGSQAARQGIVTFTKKFRDVDIEFDVEKTQGNTCVIKVVLRQPGVKDRFRGLRIGLIAEGRELASSLAPGGETIFEDVHPGSYTIVVARGGMKIAETALTFIE